MRWRRNSDEDISRLKRAWLNSGASSDYLPYKRACERAGLEPVGDGCSLCGGETWSSCSICAAELCDDCFLECNECGEGICLDIHGGGCAVECDNCEHLICPECAMCCKNCQHSHKLCSNENCNEDEEFIKRCHECDEYYCVQCSDDCYREHFADSCSFRRRNPQKNPLDKPYPWHWTDHERNYAEFTAADGRIYSLDINSTNTVLRSNAMFGRRRRDNDPKTVFRVFATVMDIIKSYLLRPDATTVQLGGAGKRERLYKRLIKHAVPPGWDVESSKAFGGTFWRLTRQ